MTYARVAALLHARIAQGYLAGWGGLDAGLPGLATGPDTDAALDGLRRVVADLLVAGRSDDVHRLLRAEHAGVNVWFSAHERCGRLDGYLADVAAARRDAVAQTDAALAAGRPAPSFGRELGYALLAARAGVAGRPAPARLAALLVEAGLWSTRRAWLNAVNIAAPADRCRAFLALLPHLNHPGLDEVLDRVVAEPDEHVRGPLLAALVPHLSAALLGRVLAAVEQFEDVTFAVDALRAVLGRLPAGLVPRARAVVEAIADSSHRGHLLLALAPLLPAAERAAASGEALALFRTVEHPTARARCLAEVAPLLPPAERAAASGEAQALARAVEPGAVRAYLLAELAPLGDAGQRLAGYAEAVAAAVAIEHPYTRAQVLVRLLPDLPDDLVPAVLAAARELDDDNRATVYAALAGYLPAEQRRPLLAEALRTRLSGIGYENYFSTELSVLAPHLPDDLMAGAIRALRELGRPGYLCRVLTREAPHLTGAALTEALDAARELARPDRRARCLAALAGQLSEPDGAGLYAEALAAARLTRDDHALWVELAERLPARWRRECLAAALAGLRRDPLDPSVAEVRDVLRPRRRTPPFGFVPLEYADRDCDDLLRCQRAWRRGAGAAATVAALRRVLDRTARRHLCRTGPVFVAAAVEFGGIAAADEYVDAVLDSYRWWPEA